MEQTLRVFYSISPWIPIVVGILAVLIVEALLKRDTEKYTVLVITIISLVTSFFLTLSLNQVGEPILFIQIDYLSKELTLLILLGTLLAVGISYGYLTKIQANHGEYYALLLSSALGTMILTNSKDLFTFFIAFELMSVSVYILSGFFRAEIRSTEAAMKYFVLGAFSTGFLLMGMAFIYGTTGSVVFDQIRMGLSYLHDPATLPLVYLGIGFLLVGILFKLGAVPFHSWVPDVYEGAPTSITTFMSTVVKIGAVTVFIRMFYECFMVEPLIPVWTNVLWFVSLLTILVGTFTALVQKNIKRMLAYSSITHAGYLLIGILALGLLPANTGLVPTQEELWFQETAIKNSLVFYLFAYTLMNVGAFSVLMAFSTYSDRELVHFDDIKGYGYRHPLLGFFMLIAMLSLSGIPFTAGFIGKFVVFKSLVLVAGVEAWNWQYHGLVLFAILTSVVSIYYYMRVVVYLFFKSPKTNEQGVTLWNYTFVAGFVTFLTLIFGLFYLLHVLFGILPNSITAIFQEKDWFLFRF